MKFCLQMDTILRKVLLSFDEDLNILMSTNKLG